MNIIPISKENHSDWSYVGLPHYKHTLKDSIVPIVIAEIGRLVSNNPIVFIENDGILNLYSLQSLLPENNLMIDNEGLWLGKYIPARYRSLPFVLASNSNNEDKKEKILCFVEDFKCVAKNFETESTKIFEKENELSDEMNKVFEFLQSIEQNEILTQNALKSIQEMNIIEDWSLSLKLKDGEKKMTGLKKIDADKLRNLSPDNLEKLNKTGGLDICFANIFSLNNVEILKNLILEKAQISENKKDKQANKSLRDITLEKQQKAQKEEMDTLVKDLLIED